MSFEDFDRYCEEHNVAEEDVPTAFAQWLADMSGKPIHGRDMTTGEPVVAIPEEER